MSKRRASASESKDSADAEAVHQATQPRHGIPGLLSGDPMGVVHRFLDERERAALLVMHRQTAARTRQEQVLRCTKWLQAFASQVDELRELFPHLRPDPATGRVPDAAHPLLPLRPLELPPLPPDDCVRWYFHTLAPEPPDAAVAAAAWRDHPVGALHRDAFAQGRGWPMLARLEFHVSGTVARTDVDLVHWWRTMFPELGPIARVPISDIVAASVSRDSLCKAVARQGGAMGVARAFLLALAVDRCFFIRSRQECDLTRYEESELSRAAITRLAAHLHVGSKYGGRADDVCLLMCHLLVFHAMPVVYAAGPHNRRTASVDPGLLLAEPEGGARAVPMATVAAAQLDYDAVLTEWFQDA